MKKPLLVFHKLPSRSLARPISEEKVTNATNKLLNGKAPGADAIPGELFKNSGLNLTITLTEYHKNMFSRNSRIHHNFICTKQKETNAVALIIVAFPYSQWQNPGVCVAEQLPDSECRLPEECDTTDMVFAAHQLQEKCQEQHCDRYTTFVDLLEAFDTVRWPVENNGEVWLFR